MGKTLEKYVLDELKDTKTKLHDCELMLAAEKHTRQIYENRLDRLRTMAKDMMERTLVDEHEALETDEQYIYSFRLYSIGLINEDFKLFCELLDLDPKECFND